MLDVRRIGRCMPKDVEDDMHEGPEGDERWGTSDEGGLEWENKRAERERRTCRPMLDAERPPAVAVAARRALVMERAADDRKRRPAAEVPFM